MKICLILVGLFLVVAIALELDFYSILEIPRAATDKEIKKAYKRLSKKYHPDKNVNNEKAHQKFVQVSESYGILSDPELREIYDKYGHSGLEKFRKSQNQESRDPFDFFRSFFGGGGYESGSQDRVLRFRIPINAVANGLEEVREFDRQVICMECFGKGYDTNKKPSEALKLCNKCKGQGVIVENVMVISGVYQKIQRHCEACGGAGKVIRHKCHKCNGQKLVKTRQEIKIVIPPGIVDGWELIFEGLADEVIGKETGDLLLRVQVDSDPAKCDKPPLDDQISALWQRVDRFDLMTTIDLTLEEALLGGWTKNLQKLTGQSLVVSKPIGKSVQHGQIDLFRNQGLPTWDAKAGTSGNGFGKAVIQYKFVLPKRTDDSEFQKLLKKAFSLLNHIKDEL